MKHGELYAGPSEPSSYWGHVQLPGYSSGTDPDTGCREQLVKLIMSYCSAWCPWALGNIYYGSITPSPTFSSIKLHHFSLQPAADQLKERCFYHTPISRERAQLRHTECHLWFGQKTRNCREVMLLSKLENKFHYDWKWNVLIGKEKRLQTKLPWSIFCLWLKNWKTQEKKAHGNKIHNLWNGQNLFELSIH